jgi:putative DNA primase/helicase
MNTVERARGRWREILPALGIETRFLTNKHGPCPLCGGRDRFRFDDRRGEGTYYCNQCGAGVGLIMLRKLHGWSYAEACAKVDEIIGREWRSPPPQQARPAQKSPTVKLAAIERLLREARSPEVVDAYLTRRGISARSSALLGDRKCAYRNEAKELVGLFPAIIAPVIGPDGTLLSAMRIYDADVTPRKKLMPSVANINGGAVRLFEPGEELGVAEGIESALAAHELFDLPTWAALSEGGLRSFIPPPGLMRLVVLADNDASFIGQRAALDLAYRLRRDDPGLMVQVETPPEFDTDWLDVLLAKRRVTP